MNASGAAAEGERSPERTPPLAYLVVVHKGPTWSREDIAPFCRLLSRQFAGEIWAFGSYDADVPIGRIRLRVVRERSARSAVNLARFTRHVLRWTEELRERRHPRLAVVSVEPFKGGLLALYAARRARGAFICEVNGVYGNPHHVADARIPGVLRLLRRIWRRMIGAFVLRRAAAVRLQFPGQLQHFARLRAGIVTRQFFDISGNLEMFRPGSDEPIVLGVGFPFRIKGFDVLCEAFQRIADRYPGWKLVLIGHRVPEEAQAAGFHHPRIETYPGLMHPRVAEWMARCAIFALPSRTDAMPRVLMEAGAAGKCRVATSVDGIPMLIEHGVDGLLVESENVGQLAAALERLMRDSSLRERLGEAARQRVAREFSGEAYLKHYAELVSAAVAQSAA